MIGDDDLLACLAHHGAVNRGLVRVVCSDAMLDVYAIDADEYLVHKDLADAFDRRWTNEGEPVSTKKSAGNDHLQIIAMTQLHRHVHRIRQNRDPLMKADTTRHLCRRRTRADREDLAIAN